MLPARLSTVLVLLATPALAQECSFVSGNRATPCGFESAGQVVDWFGNGGSKAFSRGTGQSGGAPGGALRGDAASFGASGFLFGVNSPCILADGGDVLRLGYAAKLVSGGPNVDCRAGFQDWRGSDCTDPNGGGLDGDAGTLVQPTTLGYTSVVDLHTVRADSASTQLVINCRGPQDFVVDVDNAVASTCPVDTLCLHDGRFEASVQFRVPGELVNRTAVPGDLSRQSGTFHYFDPTNAEMLVKVLDACTVNSHFWVFLAATTNVEYTVQVTDTASGATRTYENPQGQAAQAVQDTSAFACP
jgi:hypothetical protein